MGDDDPLPADKTIRLWGEICSTGMWSTQGFSIWPEDLPVSGALRTRLEAWADWYDRVDSDAPSPGDPWEGQPGMPTAEFNIETRALARALKTELPADWTVIAWDVDSWRYTKDDQAHRRLDLPGTSPS